MTDRIIQDAFCVLKDLKVEAVYMSFAAAAIKKVQIGGTVRKCKIVLVPGTEDQRPTDVQEHPGGSVDTASQFAPLTH